MKASIIGSLFSASISCLRFFLESSTYVRLLQPGIRPFLPTLPDLAALPDYGAYHTALIADSALPGKWQAGEEVVYLLVFEGELTDGSTPENQAIRLLSPRLSKALQIPIKNNWAEALWETGLMKEMTGELITAGDCLTGYWVSISEKGWADILTWLVKEQMVKIG